MTYYYNVITRQEARKLQKQNRLLKIAIAILATIIVFSLVFVHSIHTELRMNRYAMEHNCTWHSSYYINEQPVCK